MSANVRHNVRHYRPEVEALATELGCEAAALFAIVSAEVGEMPTSRTLIIRFEPHVALRRAPALSRVLRIDDLPGVKVWDQKHWYNAGTGWREVHSGAQADEWGALWAAAASEPDVAFLSASYGVFQIMGFHHILLGHETVQDMVGQALKGQEEQFRQAKRFFRREAGGALIGLMNAREWVDVATIYNGAGQATYYGGSIAKHYAAAVTELAKPVEEQEVDTLADLDNWAGRQAALSSLGYDTGPVDGSPGPRTTAAVRAFQFDLGLDADGVWGPNTRAALERAIEG